MELPDEIKIIKIEERKVEYKDTFDGTVMIPGSKIYWVELPEARWRNER